MRFLDWVVEHPFAFVIGVFALGLMLEAIAAVVFTHLGIPWVWDLRHGVTPLVFVTGH